MRFVIKTENGSIKVGGNILLASLILSFLLFAIYIYAITGEDAAASYTTINATVKQYISITPSTAIIQGIMFGTVYPNTIGNPAYNNTDDPNGGTKYNFTVDSSTTSNVDFYNKLNETLGTGLDVNETSGTVNSTYIIATNTTVTTSWTIMGNATLNCTNVVNDGTGNCWQRYYLDVAAGVAAGTYEKQFQYCGVYTTGSSTLCG